MNEEHPTKEMRPTVEREKIENREQAIFFFLMGCSIYFHEIIDNKNDTRTMVSLTKFESLPITIYSLRASNGQCHK